MRVARILWLPAIAGGLLLSLVLAGCGGSSKTQMTLTNPVANPSLPGSFSGSVFSLSPARAGGSSAVIDYPVGATVTLTALSGGYSATAYTNVAGGYQFANVPAGSYRVAVVAKSAESSTALTGSLANVIVQGGIPTLMVNVLVGDPTLQVTFTGKVQNQDGSSAIGAVVSLSVQAQPYYPQGTSSSANPVAVILPTYTAANGSYTITVPSGAMDYLLCAHSATSQVTPDAGYSTAPVTGSTTTIIPAGTTTVTCNFTLITAVNPILPTLYMDVSSTTLPAATASGSSQALISELAVAHARAYAPAKMRVLQQRLTRCLARAANTPIGSVENDVIAGQNSAPGSENYVRGYDFYRGTTQGGTFVKLGTTTDPWAYVFIDNDPTLTTATSIYYTADCYAANGMVSNPAASIQARPLPVITNAGAQNATGQPLTGQTVSGTSATLSWSPVPGALAYAIIVFQESPTFNTIPDRFTNVNLGNGTSCVINLPGTYWWAVAAYNNTTPEYATASSYTAYNEVMIVPPGT